MALKTFEDKVKKKRSLPFLGSHKSSLVLSHTRHGSVPSLIDRQPLSPEIECEIRNACALLCHNITQGIPQPSSQSQSGKCDKEQPGANTAPKTLDSLQPDSQGKDRRAKYDSGIGLDIQERDNQAPPGLGTPPFSKQHNQQILSDWSVRLVEDESISEKTSHSTEQDTGAVTAARPDGHPSWDTSSDEVFLSQDILNGIPSFTCSQSGPRLDHSKHTETTDPSSSDNTSPHATDQKSRPETPHSRQTNAIPATSSAQISQLHKYEIEDKAVIFDSDGLLHVLSAAEELQRQADLQQAVREKMCTGVIGGSVSSQDNVTKQKTESVNSMSPGDKRSSEGLEVSVGDSQPRRQKSGLLQKLWRIGIVKRKSTAAEEKDSAGLGLTVQSI